MPKKIERCVRKVKKSGKDKSSAYAICSSSTGIKRKKGGGWTKNKKTIKESNLTIFDKLCIKILTEGKNARGVRDGTGPYKGSMRRKSGKTVGRRKASGKKCPNR